MKKNLTKAIQEAIYGPRAPGGPLGAVLKPAAGLYAGAMSLRARLYQKGRIASVKLPAFVLSVGNLTVGGTGKTPMVLHLARLLQEKGHRVAVISRGYGGSFSAGGGVVSDGKNILATPAQAGDEPWLLASRLPGVAVVVGADRALAGLYAIRKLGAEILVADDAFQRLSLHRDLDILLCDHARPFGNGKTLPAGPLREPVSHGARANALVFTRARDTRAPLEAFPLCQNRPHFFCKHQPQRVMDLGSVLGRQSNSDFDSPNIAPTSGPGLEDLKGRKVLAFSGIADNAGFFGTLKHLGADLIETRGFTDHHAFEAVDRRSIQEQAKGAGAQWIITTEKDAVRLLDWEPGEIPVLALGIGLEFLPGGDFAEFVSRAVEQGKK